MDNVRTMMLLGFDSCGRPVYKCRETNDLWKDIARKDTTLSSKDTQLYSADCFDGKPNSPIETNLDVRFLSI